MCARSIVFLFLLFSASLDFPFFSFTQSQLCAYACGLALFVYWDDFRGLPWAHYLPETGDANYVEYITASSPAVRSMYIFYFEFSDDFLKK
jgi:hypothetical protein